MAFFDNCWKAFLQLAVYANLLDGNYGGYSHQTPLQIPAQHSHDHGSSSSAGVSFDVAGLDRPFTCHYPTMTGYKACNANDRSCWLQSTRHGEPDYNIETEYDLPGDDFTPEGIVREYWLEVDLKPVRHLVLTGRTQANATRIAPDGYLKQLGQVFNGSYPGPHLEACWGDTFVVHVTNRIPNLGTTIHWHGIRQLNSTQQDGVNGVTQCPIAYNETYTYRFRAEQYGHSWYHSHYQTQYSDGVAGPLTIYGPSSSQWDETFYPMLMTDWVHDNTSVVFEQELAGGAPVADGLLLNGTNTFKCSNLDPKCCISCNPQNATCNSEFCCRPNDGCFADPANRVGQYLGGKFTKVFEPGKRYLLQLINASAGAMYIFSIDDHELEVIATDLVPIVPYKTDSVFIAIGQRYQVIVTAKPKRKTPECKEDVTKCNYWIRMRIANNCGSVAQSDEETGIIRYDSNPNNTANPTTESRVIKEDCSDELPSNLRPVVPWNITKIKNDIKQFTFAADLNNVPTHGAVRWEIADNPLWLNYSDPSILNVDNNAHFQNPDQAVVNYTNHKWNNGYVYLIITGNDLGFPGKIGVPAAHPIHLHGHDFVILAQVDKPYNSSQHIPFDTENPTRRDTALLYAGGYLALAFKLDNPGIWLVHCHIAWHASSGLALQIIERQDEILGSIGPLDATEETCAGWEKMNLKFNQDDSGI